MKAQGIDFGNYTIWKRNAIKPDIQVDFAVFGFGYGDGKNKSWDQNKPECKKEERRILYSFFNHADPWRDQADFIIKECLSVEAHAFAIDWEEATHHFRTDLNIAEQAKHCKWILKRVRDGLKHERVGIYSNGSDYAWLAYYENVTNFFLWAADPDKNPADHPWSDTWWRRSKRTKYDYTFDQWSWKGYAPDYGAVNNKKSMDLTQCQFDLEWLDGWLGLSDVPDPPTPPEPPIDPGDWNQALDAGKQALEDLKK